MKNWAYSKMQPDFFLPKCSPRMREQFRYNSIFISFELYSTASNTCAGDSIEQVTFNGGRSDELIAHFADMKNS